MPLILVLQSDLLDENPLNIECTTFMKMPPKSNNISSMYYFFSLNSYLTLMKFNTLPFESSFSNLVLYKSTLYNSI